jgi:hypothetical protein
MRKYGKRIVPWVFGQIPRNSLLILPGVPLPLVFLSLPLLPFNDHSHSLFIFRKEVDERPDNQNEGRLQRKVLIRFPSKQSFPNPEIISVKTIISESGNYFSQNNHFRVRKLFLF